MSPPPGLRVILLDVNETLTDTAAIGAPWNAPSLGPRILSQAVMTAMTDALLDTTGSRSFSDHVRSAVEVLAASCGLDLARVERAVEAAAALPPRPGAAGALRRLREAGLRLVALTNSGAEAGERTLRQAGLLEHLERVLGVDAVGTFKPHPDVYAYALREVGAPPEATLLLATHPWDLAGAAHAGMHTAWVRHGASKWPSVYPEPSLIADDLPSAAEALAAR